jgi:hypothetical protein
MNGHGSSIHSSRAPVAVYRGVKLGQEYHSLEIPRSGPHPQLQLRRSRFEKHEMHKSKLRLPASHSGQIV